MPVQIKNKPIKRRRGHSRAYLKRLQPLVDEGDLVRYVGPGGTPVPRGTYLTIIRLCDDHVVEVITADGSEYVRDHFLVLVQKANVHEEIE